MSLRFFADQCVPMEVVHRLRRGGHEVILLRDVVPPRSPDPIVIAKVQELQCILVSINGDFSDIVSYPPSLYQGIISLQLHNHPEIIPKLMDRLDKQLKLMPNMSDFTHRLVLVEVHRIRIRT